MSSLSLLLRTAWRDSRKDRARLFLFMSSIILGVAAMVAIHSFNDNLTREIEMEAKTLLGADMSVQGNRPAPDTLLAKLSGIATGEAQEIQMFSMAYFPKIGESHFVRIKALDGYFPFYGKLNTSPEEDALQFQENQTVMVEEGLLVQFGLSPGDSIRIGQHTFKISSRLMSVLGSIGAGSSFAPTVYIPMNMLELTGLVQPGSLIEYSYFYKLPNTFDADEWKKANRSLFRDDALGITTVNDQKDNLSYAFGSLHQFLNLVAMIALLLACIGVASSIWIYVKNKINSIAVMRCLGMKSKEAFMVYFIQIMIFGLISILSGALAGGAVQMALPYILADFLPFEVSMKWSMPAMLLGVGMGLGVTVIFSLIPLIGIRKVSPLNVLRWSEEEHRLSKDKWVWFLYALLVLLVFGFLWWITGSVVESLVFTFSLLLAFGILFSVAILISRGARKFLPRNWSFIWRQGVSNLYRPGNQTQILILSIGLGSAILTTLFVLQSLILQNVASMGAGNQPNMILFGIETDQVRPMEEITASYGMPVVEQVPIVTMTLEGWKGRSKREWFADTTVNVGRWAANREARVSFKNEVPEDDKIVKGSYTGKVKPGDSIWISLGESYAESLDLDIGDEMVWNVQGALITTYVGSVRKINFRKMETRFLVLFPEGVLERAPQFHVLVTKSPDTKTTALYRNEVVRLFPNVSVIDLGSILVTLNEVLSKVSYVIRFMAAFSIIIGFIVLISSLYLSKIQRIKESVLLRTIGAVKSQIIKINAVEYALLGILSTASGIIIAVISSYLLARFVFDLEYQILWTPIAGVLVIISALVLFIGMYNSREVVNKSPLEVLRREV